MRTALAILVAITLAGCESEAEERERKAAREYTDGLVVVRVCRDGTRIWQGTDGRRFVINFGASIVSPDIPLKDVCD